jgi:putative oxidoreductase
MRPLLHELGWTALRVVTGGMLALNYGYPKVFGGKVHVLANALAEGGWPFAHFFAWCASLTELIAAGLVAVGLATRGAAALCCVVMAISLWQQRAAPLHDLQLPLFYLAALVNFAIAGGGRFGLDGWLKLRMPLGKR